ncbi:hypothetical protein ACSBOB_29415 [Mesorhizobium sp. ASY16-5R]|uniref:hypothetical protein n=1 Tax=Mesorhizobium sp. ASY16-5R TaxID=3445772 RepID=UPI003FA10A34
MTLVIMRVVNLAEQFDKPVWQVIINGVVRQRRDEAAHLAASHLAAKLGIHPSARNSFIVGHFLETCCWPKNPRRGEWFLQSWGQADAMVKFK